MTSESLFDWGVLTDEEAVLTPNGAREDKDKMKKENSTPRPGRTPPPRPLLLDTSSSTDDGGAKAGQHPGADEGGAASSIIHNIHASITNDHHVAPSKDNPSYQIKDQSIDDSDEEEEEDDDDDDDDESGPDNGKEPAQVMMSSGHGPYRHLNKESKADTMAYSSDGESTGYDIDESDDADDTDGPKTKDDDDAKGKTPRSRLPKKNAFYGISSSYKGVSRNRSKDKCWRATAWIDGADVAIGNFRTEEEAAKAYDKAVRDRYGDKAITNYNADGTRNYDAKTTFGAYIGAGHRIKESTAGRPARRRPRPRKMQEIDDSDDEEMDDSDDDDDDEEGEIDDSSDEEGGEEEDTRAAKGMKRHPKLSPTRLRKAHPSGSTGNKTHASRNGRASPQSSSSSEEESHGYDMDDSEDEDGGGKGSHHPKDSRKAYGTTSSYKGVSYDRKSDQWFVTASINGAGVYVGRFASEEEAAKAYDKAVRARCGDKAITNYNADGSRNYKAKSMHGFYIGAGQRKTKKSGLQGAGAKHQSKKAGQIDDSDDEEMDDSDDEEELDEEEDDSDGEDGSKGDPGYCKKRTSEYKGVSRHSSSVKNPWQASMKAALAYDKEARKVFGAKAVTNFDIRGRRNMDAKRQLQGQNKGEGAGASTHQRSKKKATPVRKAKSSDQESSEADSDQDGSSARSGDDGVKTSRPRNSATSSYKGVSRIKKTGRCWFASAWIDGAVARLGRFHTEKEAAKAYDKAVKDRYGDKAITNYNSDGSRNYKAKGTFGAYIKDSKRSPKPQPMKKSQEEEVDDSDEEEEVDDSDDEGEAQDSDSRKETDDSDGAVNDSDDGGHEGRGHWKDGLSSFYKGVSSTNDSRRTWRAFIRIKGVNKSLGTFLTEKEAALTYDAAAREAFGTKAVTNFDLQGRLNMGAKYQRQGASASSKADKDGSDTKTSRRSSADLGSSEVVGGGGGGRPSSPSSITIHAVAGIQVTGPPIDLAKRKHHDNDDVMEGKTDDAPDKRSKVMADAPAPAAASTSSHSPAAAPAPARPAIAGTGTAAHGGGGLRPCNAEPGLTREQRGAVYHALFSQYRTTAEEDPMRQLLQRAIQAISIRNPLVEEVVSSLFETGFLPEPRQLMARPDRHAELADIMKSMI